MTVNPTDPAVVADVLERPFTDCGPDGGCEECDVCRYLNFIEWAGSVGKPDGSTIERNGAMEAYLARQYPAAATLLQETNHAD